MARLGFNATGVGLRVVERLHLEFGIQKLHFSWLSKKVLKVQNDINT